MISSPSARKVRISPVGSMVFAIAGEFEEAASGGFGGAGDSSGGEDVADLQVATVAGVVGDELGGSPIEVVRFDSLRRNGSSLLARIVSVEMKYFKLYIRLPCR